MLYHSWKYLPMIQDVFGIKENQFTLPNENKDKCELDFANDEILRSNAFLDYNIAAPNFNQELTSYTADYNKLTQGID